MTPHSLVKLNQAYDGALPGQLYKQRNLVFINNTKVTLYATIFIQPCPLVSMNVKSNHMAQFLKCKWVALATTSPSRVCLDMRVHPVWFSCLSQLSRRCLNVAMILENCATPKTASFVTRSFTSDALYITMTAHVKKSAFLFPPRTIVYSGHTLGKQRSLNFKIRCLQVAS